MSSPNVISQSFKTFAEKMGHFSPLLTAASENFGITPRLTKKYYFWGDQYPIYIPILRERLTNLQYQYLESFKTIFLEALTGGASAEGESRERTGITLKT